jgi:hypothetical protein
VELTTRPKDSRHTLRSRFPERDVDWIGEDGMHMYDFGVMNYRLGGAG